MVRIEPRAGFVDIPQPMPIADLRVCAARTDQDWRDVLAVIMDHIEWITASAGIDDPFDVQPSLRGELDDLRAFYTPPHGRIFLARLDGVPVGSVGVAAEPDGVAEMKRLFVRPGARGHNLGEHLVRTALDAAQQLGCHTLRLSTIPGLMDTAIGLYRRLGFEETAPFGDIDLDSMLFLARPVLPSPDPAFTAE
ncbi:MAG: GNAT family N-acetyltransferase [Dehalococcoidia bacterium]